MHEVAGPTRFLSRPYRKFAAAIAAAGLLLPGAAHAQSIYWDGVTGGWDVAANWSTVPTATTPDPGAPPGAADIATFTINGIGTAQTVNLNANQAALGLATNSQTITTTLAGGGTNRVLSLGASGINHVAGGLTIGSATSGQQVAISLQGSQTWTSSTAGTGAVAISVVNGVSSGVAGSQTLTLSGINTGSVISGAITNGSGTVGITKTGTGVWTLSGTNTFTGPTLISTGRIQYTVPGALYNNTPANWNSTNITVSSGAALGVAVGGTGFTAANVNSLSTNAGFAAGSTLLLENAATFDQSSVIGNAGGALNLTKAGAATLVLSAANIYSGKTSINAGTLSVTSLNSVVGGTASSNLGAPTSAALGTIDIGTGGTAAVLAYTGTGETTDRVINLAGSTGGATIDQSGTGVLRFDSANTAAAGIKSLTLQGSTAGTGTFAGNIVNGSGTVSLVKIGSGAWTLLGVSTYTGATTVSAGTLVADYSLNATNVLPAASAVTLSGGTLRLVGNTSGASSQTIASLTASTRGSTLQINPSTGTGTALTITSSTVTRTAPATLHFDTSAGTPTTAAIDWNPTLNAGGIINGAFTISDNAGTGFATISSGKVVRLAGGTALAPASDSATTNFTVSASDANLALVLNAGTHQTNTITVDTTGGAGTLNLGGSTVSFASNALLVNGGNSYTISNGQLGAGAAELILHHYGAGQLNIASNVAGAGAGTVIKAGPGTTVLSGVNTYTGATHVNAGVLQFAGTMGASTINIHNGIVRLGTATGLTASNPVTFGPSSLGALQLNGNSATIGALSTNATLGNPVVENASPVLATITLGGAANATYAGVIQDGVGGGALSVTATIVGSAVTQTLSGTQPNTYTGVTTVNGTGILALSKTSGVNAIGGNLVISGGGRVTLPSNHQIPDTASVTMSGATSVFHGTGVNTGVNNTTETFATLTVTGGAFASGNANPGFTITGMASFTGGTGQTVYVGNSGTVISFGGLTLTNMTASPASVVDTKNSFALYGNSTGVRSRMTIGSLGLTLNGSVLNVRRGGGGAQGARLVLDGDVTTIGTSASSILHETAAGTTGTISVDLSSTAGTHVRTFNIGGGGADLAVSVPIVNGAATSGGITKTGPGRLTIEGTLSHTYTGPTTITSGSVHVTGTVTASAFLVDSLLTGTSAGTIGGPVTVNAGGAVNPGLPGVVGLLRINGALTATTSTSNLNFDIGPATTAGTTYDAITAIAGTANHSITNAAFNITDLGGAEINQPYNLIHWLGTTAPTLTGHTLNLPSGYAGALTIDNTGKNVVLTLTAVPEPSTALLALGGLGLLARRRRAGSSSRV